MNLGLKLMEWSIRAASRLPLGVLYVFSDVACVFLHHVVRYRLGTVRENLRKSFPEKGSSELRGIERAFYRHFSDNAVESMKLLHMSDEEMRRRMRFKNVELIDSLFAEGRDIVAYFSHCINWEWPTSVGLHTKSKMAEEADFGFVYRPLNNKIFDALMLDIRRRFGASAYPKTTVFRELIRMRKSSRRFIAGFMSDQKPSHGDPTQVLMFLNHPTAMITGTETVARKLNTAVIYWDMHREGRGRYCIECRLMCRQAADEAKGSITACYAGMLEDTIKRNPSLWLWTHKRWKYPVKLAGE